MIRAVRGVDGSKTDFARVGGRTGFAVGLQVYTYAFWLVKTATFRPEVLIPASIMLSSTLSSAAAKGGGTTAVLNGVSFNISAKN